MIKNYHKSMIIICFSIYIFQTQENYDFFLVKVHIFLEGHKILRNFHQLFVLVCTARQIIGGDFAKFCGLLRIYEI